MRKKLVSAIQLVIGLCIIAFIVLRMHSRGDLGELVDAFLSASANWDMILLAIAVFFGCLLFSAARWHYLLIALGYTLSFGRVMALFFIGHFFNAFLLGATGGDLVKACYVAAETPDRKTEIVLSVFIDRAMGLMALVGLSIGVMLVRLNFFLQHQAMRVALLFNVGLLVLTVTGLLLVFRRNLFERYAFFRRLEQGTALGEQLSRMYRSFRFCLNRPALLFKTLALSLGNHLTNIIAVYYLGVALGLELSYMDYLTVFLIVNAIVTIPITPSGLGTRESACILLLGAFGVADTSAVTLSLMLYGVGVLWSLVGGVIYVFYAMRRGRVADVMAEKA